MTRLELITLTAALIRQGMEHWATPPVQAPGFLELPTVIVPPEELRRMAVVEAIALHAEARSQIRELEEWPGQILEEDAFPLSAESGSPRLPGTERRVRKSEPMLPKDRRKQEHTYPAGPKENG